MFVVFLTVVSIILFGSLVVESCFLAYLFLRLQILKNLKTENEKQKKVLEKREEQLQNLLEKERDYKDEIRSLNSELRQQFRRFPRHTRTKDNEGYNEDDNQENNKKVII